MLIYDVKHSNPEWQQQGYNYSEEQISTFAIYAIFVSRQENVFKLKKFLDVTDRLAIQTFREDTLPNMGEDYNKGIPDLQSSENPIFADYICAINLKDVILTHNN